MARGGKRENSGRKSSWGFPSSDLKNVSIPKPIWDALLELRTCTKGQALIDVLKSTIQSKATIPCSVADVIKLRARIELQGEWVDNHNQQANVSRYLNKQGIKTSQSKIKKLFTVLGYKTGK